MKKQMKRVGLTDAAFCEESKARALDALKKAAKAVKESDLAWAKTYTKIAADFIDASFWTQEGR